MTVRIFQGHVIDRLRELPDESVHAVVTSPPYWRQRDYGMPDQIGLETTPEEYVEKLTTVFREVRRVLRSDGTAWVNIGDKWASGGNGGGGKFMVERGHAWDDKKGAKGWRNPPAGYKDKDLVGVPWMLAFAMRADEWFLRQCNIWAKPNCMPESVRDRTTVSHEYVFHFSKCNDYWYDAEAARTPATPATETRLAQDIDAQTGSVRANAGGKTNGNMKAVGRLTGLEREQQQAAGANLRSVWWMSPAQYRDSHFAVMPNLLAEICIRAATSSGGVCAKCGAPWDRLSEKGDPDLEHQRVSGGDAQGEYHGTSHKYRDDTRGQNASSVKARVLAGMRKRIHLGWQQSCDCEADAVPAVVLDPFGGVGTTGLVADRLGRDAILIELNPAYADMARLRVRGDAPLLAEVC